MPTLSVTEQAGTARRYATVLRRQSVCIELQQNRLYRVERTSHTAPLCQALWLGQKWQDWTRSQSCSKSFSV